MNSSDTYEDEDKKKCLHENQKIKENKNIQFKILKEGNLLKKCGWFFYRERRLILTNQPRLSYYSVKKNEYKVK